MERWTKCARWPSFLAVFNQHFTSSEITFPSSAVTCGRNQTCTVAGDALESYFRRLVLPPPRCRLWNPDATHARPPLLAHVECTATPQPLRGFSVTLCVALPVRSLSLSLPLSPSLPLSLSPSLPLSPSPSLPLSLSTRRPARPPGRRDAAARPCTSRGSVRPRR